MSSAVMTYTDAAAPASGSGLRDTDVIWILASSSIDRSAMSAGKMVLAKAGSASSKGSSVLVRRKVGFIGVPCWRLNHQMQSW